MEQNRLISQELEDMRSQITSLRNKLEEQAIINEAHIRNSMRSKMSDISRTIAGTIIAGAIALPYCIWFFWSQGLSTTFVISTGIMLTLCLGLTILQQVRLRSLDFSKGNLVETAAKLSRIKKHYREWQWVAVPMLIAWFGWLMYEIINKLGNEPYVIGFCCGAGMGGIIGGIIGFRINRKVIRKTSEILSQIEELHKGE